MKKTVIFSLALFLALTVCACGNSTSGKYTVTKSGTVYVVDPEASTIFDGTNTYQYTFSGNASSYRIDIIYPDGSFYWYDRQEMMGSGGGSSDYDENRYVSGGLLCDVLEAGAPAEKESHPGKILLIILLLGIGLFNIVSPETAWFLSDGWKFRDAEPSDLSLGLTRGGGVACIIIAIIIIFAW